MQVDSLRQGEKEEKDKRDKILGRYKLGQRYQCIIITLLYYNEYLKALTTMYLSTNYEYVPVRVCTSVQYTKRWD